MSLIQILLLGPPEVHLDQRPVAIPLPEARALLFYLAYRGTPIDREDLLEFLWGHRQEPDHLDVLLEALQREFSFEGWLHEDGEKLGLDFSQCYVDLREFQDLIDQAGRVPWQISSEQPLPDETYGLLHRAIELWRGPHFLFGFDANLSKNFHNWLSRTRKQTENMHVNLLERLSDHARAKGNLEQALQKARLALMTQEMNEELHFRVLRSLVEMERKSEAREYFHYIEGLFRQEYETAPAPKLVDLYRQIREDTSLPSPEEANPRWNLRPSVKAPFVGRQRELNQLSLSLQYGGVVFLLGESGAGKTRLLQEFTALAREKPRVLYSVCRTAESNLPFQPFIDLFRYTIQTDEWLALSNLWASQLTLLLPELSTMRPDLERPWMDFSPETDMGQARSLLMEAIRQVFLLSARENHILYCLDDAQWADEATLATIAYLTERPPFSENSLLVMAARREEKNPHIEEILLSVRESPHFTQINLSQLTPQEVAEIMQYILGFKGSDAIIHQLSKDTGGNALFILETLQALKDQDIQPDHLMADMVPLAESVHSLIQARFNNLSRASRDVLEIGAIVGMEFDPEIVAVVGKYNSAQINEVLENLVEHLLIEPVSQTPQDVRHRFIHSKFHEVLLQEINPLRARQLHSKVASALKAKSGQRPENQAAVLAQHYELAGDFVQAFDAWYRAGKHARQLVSVGEALQAFRRAENLIDEAYGLSEVQIYNLFNEFTKAAYEIEDADTIERINQHLLQISKIKNSEFLAGAALNGLSDADMVRNQYVQGLERATRAISYLEKSSYVNELMEAYNHQGVFLLMLGRFEEALASFQDALAVGAQSQDLPITSARANALYQISIVQTLRGLPESGFSHAARSLNNYQKIHRVHGEITAYSAMGISSYFMGRLEDARQNLLLGLDLANRIQSWRMKAYLHLYRALTELAAGNLDTTVEQIEQAREIGNRYSHEEITATCYRIEGDLHICLMDPENATQSYMQSLQVSQEGFLVPDVIFRLGASLSQSGQYQQGQEYLRRAVQIARESGLGMILMLAQNALASAHSLQKEWGIAYQIASQVHKEASRRKVPAIQLSASNLIGEIALQNEDFSRAVQCFETVAQDAARINHLWIEITARQLLYRTLVFLDRPNQEQQEQIKRLLDSIEAHATQDTLPHRVRAFREKVMASL